MEKCCSQKTTEPITLDTIYTAADRLRDIMIRFGINRNNYLITPGLYKIGKPDMHSQVLVTSNYKLTINRLKQELSCLNVWIIVLDTKGVNVWCAAGKGTFGTDELVRKIESTGIKNRVVHNNIIVPQLGAVGINKYAIKKITGLTVHYGPVRAKDIKDYINNNYTKTDKQRQITFKLTERLPLTPIEFFISLKYLLIFFVLSMILHFIRNKGVNGTIIYELLPILAAYTGGTILFPIVLPYLPGRSFALKGGILGLIISIAVILTIKPALIIAIAIILTLTPLVSFLSLNFTGSTTFTSLAGVKKEMRIGLPIQLISVISGITLYVIGYLVN